MGSDGETLRLFSDNTHPTEASMPYVHHTDLGSFRSDEKCFKIDCDDGYLTPLNILKLLNFTFR